MTNDYERLKHGAWPLFNLERLARYRAAKRGYRLHRSRRRRGPTMPASSCWSTKRA
jgi:hypothetical protein